MKLCVPVIENKGIESKLSDHFGHSPFFAIVDTDDLAVNFINNGNKEHAGQKCAPMMSLEGLEFDGIVVSSIGLNALNKLKESGYNVYKTTANNLSDIVIDFKNEKLEEVTPHNVCSVSSHKFDCSE